VHSTKNTNHTSSKKELEHSPIQKDMKGKGRLMFGGNSNGTLQT